MSSVVIHGDPSVQDISAEHVWPLLGEVKAKYLLLEGANPRHRRDVQCFELAVQKGYFKGHQVCRCPNIPNWELVQVWRTLSSRTERYRYVWNWMDIDKVY